MRTGYRRRLVIGNVRIPSGVVRKRDALQHSLPPIGGLECGKRSDEWIEKRRLGFEKHSASGPGTSRPFVAGLQVEQAAVNLMTKSLQRFGRGGTPVQRSVGFACNTDTPSQTSTVSCATSLSDHVRVIAIRGSME